MFRISTQFLKASRAAVMGAAFAIGALSSAQAADQALIDAAKAEGKVVWYTPLLVNTVARPMKEAFEAKYGIEVEMVNGTSGDLYKRIISEADAGQLRADVNGGFSTVAHLLEADLIEPYLPASTKAYGPGYIHPEGYYMRAVSYFMGTAVNSDLIAKGDYPKNLEDLLDPKWKGRIVWAAGPLGGGPNFIGVVLDTMGKEKGMDYLTKLAAQEIVNLPSNQRVVLDSVISGENLIGLSMFNHHIPISQSKGAPVEFLKLEPIHAIGQYVYLLKGPNRNAGKLFLDFVMSEEGQKVISQGGYIPTHPNVDAKNPVLKPETGGFNTHVLTPEWVAENKEKNMSIYTDLFVKN